jgi:hypothetical protein
MKIFLQALHACNKLQKLMLFYDSVDFLVDSSRQPRSLPVNILQNSQKAKSIDNL